MEPSFLAIGEIPNARQNAYTKQFKLESLLPEDTTRFFRYGGSLTTPGCNEIVVWTVFRAARPVSGKQMTAFRQLFVTTPTMKNNFRPTLPLNGS